ncbi:MAG: M28 family peptidase [Bacteroidetes bacterium]|nr:M28 family peptidase [Bacteroidota bacterium]
MRTMKIYAFCFFILTGVVSKAADTTLIRQHFKNILETPKSRSYENTAVLNQVAAYIHDYFGRYGDSTVYQDFKVQGSVYRNVITSFGPPEAERIIVGAHYDVCGEQDGADDNASGIIGLLELARMLAGTDLKYRVDLVAYSLEEPPFFGTDEMGSYIHAKYLYDNQIKVYGMICMDMIGLFSDEKNSQAYPLGLLKLFYGSRGDYLTVVRKFHSGSFARKTKKHMKNSDAVKVKSIKAPEGLAGIDLSDHLNYWRFGFSAVFITDTGFFRNTNYHKPSDTVETIDIERMAGSIDALFETLKALNNR